MILAPVLKQRYFDSNGNPLAGGKLYSYEAGTSTPQATYTDAAGGTANANPVVLDANGEAAVFIDPALTYKFVLHNSSDVLQFTVDNVGPDDTISTDHIIDLAVTTAKIADDAVTAAKLSDSADTDGDRAVTTNHIRDSAVTTAKINDSAVTTAKINDGAVTQAKRAALGQQVSSSCGDYSTTSATFADVTNLSVSITTTGRPVFIGLIHDGSVNEAVLLMATAGTDFHYTQFLRDATSLGINRYSVNSNLTLGVPVSALNTVDFPVAGTYTYKLQLKSANGGSMYVRYAKLIAYEL